MPRLLYVVATDAYFLSHRLSLAQSAKQQGYDIWVAAKDTGYKDSIEKEGFTFVPLKSLQRTGKNPFQDLRTIKELHTLYKKITPDLVHHVAMKPVLYGSMAAFFKPSLSVVNALTGLGFLFISNTWWVRGIRSMVTLLFRILFNRKNTTLIVQNRDDYEKFREFVPKSKIALIRGSGVDTTHFCPAPSSPPFPFTVTLVARMLKDKGVKEAVEAIKGLHNARLWLCGDVDLENPNSLTRDDLRSFEKQGNCKWLGSRKDIADLYRKSHVALLPSYREGLPKSLLEAAACGLPLVTTDVPGCREVVDTNGFLAPLKESAPIKEALQNLQENEALRKEMGNRSRKKALEEFSKEQIGEETLFLYGSLLSRASS